MGLIEQAAKRLEELRRAGVEVPASQPASPGAEAPPPPQQEPPASSATPAALEAPVPAAQRPAAKAPARPAVTRTTARQVKLDLGRLATNGFVTPDVPRSRMADEFRILKRPILANATPSAGIPVKNGNLVMVTSAAPAEGKTFTSVNLAMSIAMELDRTVLLVDGDVARPSLPRTLGLEPTRGLLDVLASDNKADLSELLLKTNVPNLTLLLAGSPHPRASEMLASNAMTTFLQELATKYTDRIVIFDSPPLLPTTEARVLATHMGQVVFVVHAETTLQKDVKQALATIESCPVKLLVLNGATSSGQGAYGYGYGYGYGA